MSAAAKVGRLLSSAGQLLTGFDAQAPFRDVLRRHFGAAPERFPIVCEQFRLAELPNVHLAVEAFTSEPGRRARLEGIVSDYDLFGVQLAQLAAEPSPFSPAHVKPGPVAYTNVALAEGSRLACVERALFLVDTWEGPLAMLLVASDQSFRKGVHLEVMARERAKAEAALGEIRQALRAKNVFRGHLVSLSLDTDHELRVSFEKLPRIGRDDVILPAAVLERIERQTVGFSRHREALRKAGRHLKRGLLLHGPPGTGKTLTAMYLASRMPERTVLVLTGRGLGLIEQSCAMARLLEPATVILEDVDLVAEDRQTRADGCSPLLFELLNEMDGLREDADVLFLLTTNRPQALEAALAARPGRIDQAIEVPLPDEECRERLLKLYGKGLELRLEEPRKLVERTKGVSAAFIKELVRRAALFAADDGGGMVVEDRHVEDALRELMADGGR